jgi:PQQ enzyme repeat
MVYRFLEHEVNGYKVPAIDSIKNGIGNGTIIVIDLKTGKTKWQHPTEFPT